MAARFKYYDDWKKASMACPDCGWRGNAENIASTGDWGLVLECPGCETELGCVAFPTDDETEEAAATGNADAIRELPNSRAHRAGMAAVNDSLLRHPLDLPDIRTPEVAIDLHLEEESGEVYFALLWNGERLWRELAIYGRPDRFNEICKLLQLRYKGRLKSFRAVGGAIPYLAGDVAPGEFRFGSRLPG